MGTIRRTGRFGLVVAIVAAVLACTGTAVAVKKITSRDIANGTIRTVDMSSQAKRALKGNRGRRGLQGVPGAQGAKGDKGDKGDKGGFDKVVFTGSASDNEGGVPDEVPLGDELAVSAHCPAGMTPVSGGFDYYTIQLDGQGDPVPGTAFSDPDMVVNLDSAADELPVSNDPNVPSGDGVLDSWTIIVYNGGGANDPGYHDFAEAFAHCVNADQEFFPPPPATKGAAAGSWRNVR